MTIYETPYGPIYAGGPCEDSYDNLVVYDQPPAGGAPIILQQPAVRSFRAAENAYAKVAWRPGMPRTQRRKNGTRFRPIILTGSHRSCATQTRLYASDSKRYAPPSATLHPRGLAIDVHTAYLNRAVHRILADHGWRQSRPIDEPWHASFHLSG